MRILVNYSFVSDNTTMKRDLLVQCVNMSVATMGLVLCMAATTLTFLNGKTRNRFLLFGCLYISECFFSFARIIAFIFRTTLILAGTYGLLIPVHECSKQVFATLISVSMVVTALPICFIAVQVFVAVSFPTLYRSRFTSKMRWYATVLVFLVGTIYGVMVSLITSRNHNLVHNDCFVPDCVPAGLSFGLPLLINLLSCIFALFTIRRYKRFNSISPQSSNFNASSSTAGSKRFIVWLYCAVMFTVVFNMVPIISFFVSHAADVKVSYGFIETINVFFAFKSVCLPITCLHFREYREAAKQYSRLCWPHFISTAD